MAHPNRQQHIEDAWRALSNSQRNEGWQVIPLGNAGSCSVKVGRHFPGNEEGLLVGFAGVLNQGALELPSGKGFSVRHVEHMEASTTSWIALVRHEAAERDLFLKMALDVLQTLSGVPQQYAFYIFLERIRAWQRFMSKSASELLGIEAQIGLFGELEVLGRLLDAGVEPTEALRGWAGPLGKPHDFQFARGALEVKSSVSKNDFVVHIASLAQLDDLGIGALFLVALRLTPNTEGHTLPAQVMHVRQKLTTASVALALFNSLLLSLGYLDEDSGKYNYSWSVSEVRLLPIEGDFPRLTRNSVSAAIRDVRYALDLNQLQSRPVTLIQALSEVGAI